jgi:hypothetical protein
MGSFGIVATKCRQVLDVDLYEESIVPDQLVSADERWGPDMYRSMVFFWKSAVNCASVSSTSLSTGFMGRNSSLNR